MMGSGRPYQNKDYLRILLAVIVGSAICMYYSFEFMTYSATARSTYIQNLYESFANSVGDGNDGKPQNSQRVVVTGGLVSYVY